MAPFTPPDSVLVKQVRGKGRGVFARRRIAEGEVIERCPVLVLPLSELWSSEAAANLSDYVFHWNDRSLGLALGYGSLYNHSYTPNARCEDRGRRAKLFVALRDIERGEEITINYGGAPEDQSPVGFEVR